MGQVVHLVSESTVDSAWDELCAHRAPLIGNPRLLLDRQWVQREARLHSRFTKLFLLQDRPR